MTLEEQLKVLSNEVYSLKDEFYKDRFTSKEIKTKEIIYKNILILEQKSATPSVCVVGSLCVVGGKLYVCSASNTWAVVGSQS